MSGSTLVCIPTVEQDGTFPEDLFVQPWHVEKIEAALIGDDPDLFDGSLVTLGVEPDRPKSVFTRLRPAEVAARVDAARRAIDPNLSVDVQPVRVTNWMAQAWVLILVHFIGDVFLWRFSGRVGDCLLWFRNLPSCQDGLWWWLP